ncbi:MAG: YggU family protein [Thermoplasmata archaeon]|nr:YggU family protein [Thermoplasmata archaeon]
MELADWRTALRAVDEDNVHIDLYVEPGASNQALGPYDPWRQRIKVRVTAPATEGKANDELAHLLADHLKVPPKAVQIVRGAMTRRKTVRVIGVSFETAVATMGPVLGEGETPG